MAIWIVAEVKENKLNKKNMNEPKTLDELLAIHHNDVRYGRGWIFVNTALRFKIFRRVWIAKLFKDWIFIELIDWSGNIIITIRIDWFIKNYATKK